MTTNIEIIATTRCFLSARLTIASIIEQHSALDDDAVTRRQSASDGDAIALLDSGLDRTRLEGPGRDFDEHLIGVVVEDQRGGRDDWHRLLRRQKAHAGKHPRLQPDVGVLKRDAYLGAARIGVEHIADEQHLAS